MYLYCIVVSASFQRRVVTFPPFFFCTLSSFWRRLAGELSSFPASYLRAAAAPLLRERREVALSDDISITNFLRGRRRSRRWNKRRRKSVEILRRRCHFSHLSSPATCRIYSYSCFLKSPDESLEGRARATLLFQQTQHYYCRKRGRTEDLVAEEEAALSFLPFLSALSQKKGKRGTERERERERRGRKRETGGKRRQNTPPPFLLFSPLPWAAARRRRWKKAAAVGEGDCAVR